jgi:D-alanine--poly(phosphoribitol) ligase subunit 2
VKTPRGVVRKETAMATMTHEEVEEKMLDMLEEVCGDEEVRDHRDEDLFELGFLDSMAAVELLVDIEDEFDVSIAPTEVEREEMNTVNLIIEQVEKRL